MSHSSRRSFLKAGVAAGALASANVLQAQRRSATDWVPLGKSNIKVTRLAFGTGSIDGSVQQALGQKGVTRLVDYAHERGIRFFETAEGYGESQRMLGIALKTLPRDSYRLMSKVTTGGWGDPMKQLEQMRRDSETDYFDIMLLHWQHTASWPEDSKRWQDAILEAEHRQMIRSHGASVHGLPALSRVPTMSWLQVAMIRMNHKGVRMDTAVADDGELGDVPQVVQHVQQAKAQRLGIISMKLIGEGAFNHEDRQKAMRFAFRHAGVDTVSVGYKNTAEIDEAIDNVNLAFA